MRVFARPLVAASLIAALSACSHSGASPLPFTANSNDRAGTDSTATVSPSSILYVSSAKTLYAYPLTTQGTASPSATYTPHVDQQANIAGIAVAGDGDVGILQNYYPETNAPRCRIVVYQATASSAPPSDIDCGDYGNAVGYGIGTQVQLPLNNPSVATGDAFDVLSAETSASTTEYIARYDESGNEISRLTLPRTTFRTFTVGQHGHDFPADPTQSDVERYAYAASDSNPLSPDDLTTSTAPGPVAVAKAGDKTLWVTTTGSNGDVVLEGYAYVANAPYGSTPGKIIDTGMSASSFAASAIALDTTGNLYLGLTSATRTPQTSVRVYNALPTSTTYGAFLFKVNNPTGTDKALTGIAIADAPTTKTQPTSPGAATQAIDFSTYSDGPVRGQNGWLSNSCGNNDYDANVVDTSSYPNANFAGGAPSRALQVDNAVTQGCFSGLATPVLAQNAGISSSITDSTNFLTCGNTCDPYYATQFTVTSATGQFQPALETTLSPVWTNQGARMQYVGLWHTQDPNGAQKLLIFTNDVEGVASGYSPPCFECANFVAYEVAYVDPTVSHTIGMTTQFVAPDQDVVTIYVDGVASGVSQQSFRTWADYYLYDTESDPGAAHQNSRAVDDLLVRPSNFDSCANFADYANGCTQGSGSTGSTTAGNGFLFANIASCAGTASTCASTVMGASGGTTANARTRALTGLRSSKTLRRASLGLRTVHDVR